MLLYGLLCQLMRRFLSQNSTPENCVYAPLALHLLYTCFTSTLHGLDVIAMRNAFILPSTYRFDVLDKYTILTPLKV